MSHDELTSPALRAMAAVSFAICAVFATACGASSQSPGRGVACGDGLRCGANQVCVHAPCGVGLRICMPLPDGGACPAGWTHGNCGESDGCTPLPCTPPPPVCVTLPLACAHAPTCNCLPLDVCGGVGTCTNFSDGQVYCAAP